MSSDTTKRKVLIDKQACEWVAIIYEYELFDANLSGKEVSKITANTFQSLLGKISSEIDLINKN